MIGVIVHWENADWVYRHSAAIRKMLKFYMHTLKAFGYNRLVLVDTDKTEPIATDAEVEFSVFASLEKAMANLKGSSFVFVEDLPTAENLRDFRHPSGDTCYIIGSDYGKLTPPAGSIVVKIPTQIPLWAHVAMAIVLNDRRQKEERC